MPIVQVVVKHGKSTVGSPARPWAGDKSVQDVITAALVPFPDLKLRALEAYPSPEHDFKRRSELVIDLLSEYILSDMTAIGTHFIAYCDSTTTTTGRAGVQGDGEVGLLPSAFEQLRDQRVLQLPTKAMGDRFDFKIYNALIDHLKSLALGWQDGDVEGSGKQLLVSLRMALQYLLPFEISGALGRTSFNLPARFSAEKLQVRATHPGRARPRYDAERRPPSRTHSPACRWRLRPSIMATRRARRSSDSTHRSCSTALGSSHTTTRPRGPLGGG